MMQNQSSDSQLVEAYRNGDETAFESLVQRHGPMVFNICRKCLTDVHAAEDATQSVFLVLAHKAAGLQHSDKIANWLCRVAWNVSARSNALYRRRRKHEQVASAQAATTQDRETGDTDLKHQLNQELESLPEKFREPILLYYFEGRSAEESAEMLGLALGTFSSRISRAKDMLRDRLTRKNAAVSAMVVAGVLTSLRASSAGLPIGFATSTAQAAASVLAGKTSAVAPHIGALTRETLRSMFHAQVAKWGTVAAALVILSALPLFYFHFNPAAKPLPIGVAPVVVVPPKPPSPMDAKLANLLNADWRNYMPDEVLRDMQGITGIEFAAPAAINADHPFSLKFTGMSNKDVLEKLCAEFNLEYETRNDAVVVFQKLDPARFAELTKALENRNPVLRSQAVLEMAQTHNLRALSAVIEYLNDPDELVRYWAAMGLFRHSGRLLGYSEKSEVAATALIKLLEAPPRGMDRAMLFSLLEKTRSATALQLYTSERRDNPDERLFIAGMLRPQAFASAQAVLEGFLDDTDARVRAAAVGSLARPSGPAGIKLLGALQDADENVRASAVTALAKSPDATCVSAVRGMLGDASPVVRTAAALAAGALNDQVSAETLKTFMTDANWDVRVAAASALVKLHGAEDVPRLVNTVDQAGNEFAWMLWRENYVDPKGTVGGSVVQVVMWRRKLQRVGRTVQGLYTLHNKQKLDDTLYAALQQRMSDSSLDPRFVGGLGCVRDPRINDLLVDIRAKASPAFSNAANMALFVARDARAFDTYFAGAPLSDYPFPGIEQERSLALLRSLIRLAQVGHPSGRPRIMDEIGMFEHPLATQFLIDTAKASGTIPGSAPGWSLTPDRISFLLDAVKPGPTVDRNESQAIALLAKIREPRARAALLDGLRDADPARRNRFAAAMNGVFDKEIVETLAALAAHENDAALRVSALRALGRDRTNDARALKAILKGMTSPNAPVRLAAAQSLANGAQTLKRARGLLRYLNDSDPMVREYVFRALLLSHDPRAVDVAIKRASALQDNQLIRVVESFGQEQRARTVLEKLLRSENTILKRSALNALVLQNAPCNVDLLASLMNDTDPLVRIGVLGMLSGGHNPAEMKLINASVTDANESVRRVAKMIQAETNVELNAQRPAPDAAVKARTGVQETAPKTVPAPK